MFFRLSLILIFITSTLFSQELIVPKTYDFTLTNGLRVILIEDDYQPILLMNLLINSGTNEDVKVGTSLLLAGLLTKGTRDFPSSDFSETVDINGASIGASVGYTYIHASMTCLTSVKQTMIHIFSDMILHPSFSKKDFDLLKAQMIVNLEESQSDNKWLLSYFATKHYY
ncbi:hypothetical protein DID80_02930, partial [Candidatus Marinamargulisbacteria bacterium SCGC AAA071-K20]